MGVRPRRTGSFYIKERIPRGYTVFEGHPDDYPYVSVIGCTLTLKGARKLVERARAVALSEPEIYSEQGE